MSGRREQPDFEDEQAAGEFTVQNEFTTVQVRKIRTRNGERLEISSFRVPHTIRLDALVLESLTWRQVLDLGTGLETPFGPGKSATEPQEDS